MTQDAFAPVPAAAVWHPDLLGYKFNATHPMDPARLELTERLCRDLGVFDAGNLTLIAPEIAADDALAAVHHRSYIAAVRHASDTGEPSVEHGLGTEDTPVFAGIHTGAARIASGTLQLAEAVHAGTIARGVNFAGGMHHAAYAHAGGFCVYNDAALALRRLIDRGARRVVYIDVDAHHGDGTQAIFYDDPRVMTISLHQTGVTLYPGTGYPNEIGAGAAEGTSVNISVPDGSSDAGWLRAFHAVVPALVRAFEPEVIVSQHGCDSHAADEMSDLQLSMDALRQIALDIRALADEHCGSRWIATGGGGYSVHDVVPRAWTHLTAIVAGAQLPAKTPVPESWRQYVSSTYGVDPPASMGDGAAADYRGWDFGYDPENAVDRAIIQTRKELFPLWGLDPYYD